MPRGRGKTQKKSKLKSAEKDMSIPELRKSLEHVSTYAEGLVQKGGEGIDAMAKAFATEWKKTFGKTLDFGAAKSYLEHMTSMTKGQSKAKGRHAMTRKRGHGKQRGGAQDTMLTGAPLDHLTRPGLDLPYGNFLAYVKSGFWNPEQAHRLDCGQPTQDLPRVGMGSNLMRGGGMFTFRPFVAENPASVMQDMQTAWKGQPGSPGPEAWNQTWSYKNASSLIGTVPSTTTYDRNLARDVTTR
jgi:hypothetical protein